MSDHPKIKLPDGFNHQAFLSIDSTNKQAKRKIEEGAKSGLWITAGEQTGGRGRGDRHWVSNPGNLYCSLIKNVGKDLKNAAQLSFVTSLAVRDTVAGLLKSDDVKCKWPNDVMVAGRKICGILLETHTKAGAQDNYIIIGIGINIEHHPDLTLYQASHINEQSDIKYSPDDVFNCLSQNMARWLDSWRNEGFSYVREEWLKQCKGLGETITVRMPNQQLVGRFVDLDSGGALMLDIDGEIKLIHSGDIFF
ncbi:MAG: biotin--[acetyl-CoA-carboxylase] ligase [Kordiimonadaceae bacterium]|jgi:BirA family transcriptional regulator, biotin operon repressor / biotin---[acetyl-CoA-carboxylase] ligase|nr:biotin--[acetyl-CoA-carboxylase] ligase [Kordiimonadaceae bacterium]MBT6037485.1 biotin--[acetyl-CoA-carboxylase] ligase [Kordiimonadaceae bacterium]MBT6329419.1 biotin--[acetyl-CoA-carboxylase] ligase [Kordiimonadaceae bacterium]MBT7582651.1 biotin--[acetyl-CoA-carboxylase] ligase [Kordiimonadaceae bacterium]